jgi:hypothetical protein
MAKTQPTVQDEVAARVQSAARDDARTFELPVPRRKRYTLQLDLDAGPPADAEPNAPQRPLEL